MSKLGTSALVVGLLSAGFLIARAAAATSDQNPAQEADRALAGALEKSNAAAVGKLLDAQLEWTDARGQTRTKTEAMQDLSGLAADNQGDTDVKTYDYRTVEVITGVHHNARFLRVWVKRAEDWRAFVILDTAIAAGTAPFSTATSDATGKCENPCRTIPFKHATAADVVVVATLQRLKMDEWHPDPDDWARYVVDDVFYVTSAGALSKADRVAHLTQQKQSGAAILPGDPVISMRMFDFGEAAVMITQNAPYRGGKPYYSVRVWTLRDGRWQLANSQQTTIDAAAPIAGIADDQQAVLRADHDLVHALEGADRPKADELLDADFTWISTDGRNQSREDVLQVLPKPIVGDESDAKVLERTYGQVGVVAVDSGRSHVLRLWVKRKAGWRALHFNEIMQPAAQATAGDVAVPSEAGVVTPCVNPCKSVPFKATSASAQAAMTALQELDTGSANRDMELWASRVLEECLIVDSAGAKPITKAERMAKTIQQKKTGADTNEAPPLLWAQLYDFGDTVVMLALHQPYKAKPYYATRLWVKRDGRFQLAASYHTTIEDVPAFTLLEQLPAK
jgi:hypothetical protein